jgi:hypothetical protein
MAQNYSSKWVDPNGYIFSVPSRLSHSSWIRDNRDFLEEEYDIDIPIGRGFWKLIADGWIRMVEEPQGVTFTIKRGFDNNILKRLEEILFSIFSNDAQREVCIVTPNQRVVFKWNEFIESGLSFIEFVKSIIRIGGDY